MQVIKHNWGVDKDGKEVFLYSLSNTNNQTVNIINYGGIITSWLVPDADGNLTDIVLGKDSFEDYLENKAYMGCIVGRVANRIKNGRFSLNGKDYQLALNDGENHNHGGIKGFDKVVWDSAMFNNQSDCGIVLKYLSRDGEENYPGNLHITVTYTFTDDNELLIDYSAETDKITVFNPTNHTYFNLAGDNINDILDTLLKINSSYFAETDKQYVPTGRILPLENEVNSFMDFRKIGDRIADVEYGYNESYILNNPGNINIPAAIARDEASGRALTVFTTEPTLQLYTAGYMYEEKGKKGKKYGRFAGFCLETQHLPDSPNQPDFTPIILLPGEKFASRTIYQLS